MSRELPETKLTKSYEPMVPGSTEWMVNFQDERTLAPLGFVYCPPNPIGVRRPQNPWCAQASVVGGAQEVGWHPTRKAAVIAVEKAYQRFQDELEAHKVAEVMSQVVIDVDVEVVRQQREHPGEHLVMPENLASLAGPMSGPEDRLEELGSYGERSAKERLAGIKALDLDMLWRDLFVRRMVDWELTRRSQAQEIARRKSHQLWTVQDQFKHALTKSDQLVMGSHRLNLLKVGDSPLVRELHEHLVSPWHLTTPVMDALLDRVRNLEARVAESGRE